MINLELTESELVFLQRLIGHSMAWDSVTSRLYDKIVDKTNSLKITSNVPLKLKDVSKNSWYFNDDNRLLLKLEE